jgi:hypothetical protein
LERYMGPVEQTVKDDIQDVEVNEDKPDENIIPDDDELDALLGLKDKEGDGESEPPASTPQ